MYFRTGVYNVVCNVVCNYAIFIDMHLEWLVAVW